MSKESLDYANSLRAKMGLSPVEAFKNTLGITIGTQLRVKGQKSPLIVTDQTGDDSFEVSTSKGLTYAWFNGSQWFRGPVLAHARRSAPRLMLVDCIVPPAPSALS